MSVNIRYLTNGNTTLWKAEHTDTGEQENYNKREETPICVRHYATQSEPTFCGPDKARILDVQDILYPNFPKCQMSEHYEENCIAESCIVCDGDYENCRYFKR